jgi:ribosome biogenesis GTPase
MNDIADIDPPDAGAPGYRGGDRCVVELHPGIVDLRLIGFDGGFKLVDRGRLGIEGLSAGVLARNQFGGPRQIGAGVCQHRLIFFEIGFGLPQRRLERELVLAWDSGARPVVVLTKRDLVDDPAPSELSLHAAAPGVPIVTASGISGEGIDELAAFAAGNATIALLGASGVGKSTLINALVGRGAQATAAVRDGDGRGRHTTVATQLIRLPGGGWLVDTPGVRAVSLWSSGRGIERAFADVFDVMDDCRFRDCKHEDEPGCAVQAAIAAGTLDPLRLASMKRLVAEELALEEEQRVQLKAQDRRGVRKVRVK